MIKRHTTERFAGPAAQEPASRRPASRGAPRITIVALVLVGFLGAMTAPGRAAAAGPFYVAAGIGSSHVSYDASSFSAGSSGTGYEFSGGIQPLPMLAGEIGYVGFPRAFAGINWADTWGVGADALGILPLPLVHLYGRVGILGWHVHAHSPDLSFNRSGTGLDYGAGASASWGSLGARLQFQRFDIAHARTMQLTSIGLTWSL